MTNDKAIIVLAILLVASLMALTGALVYANTHVEVKEVNNTVTVEKTVVVDSNKTNDLYNYFAEDIQDKKDEVLQNDTAKSLVLAEIAKKDFKKDLVALLNDNSIENQSVEDYKDIEIYYSNIEDSSIDDTDAEVEMLIKVKGFNDGDTEDDFKARLTVTFNVSELVVEDNFEDADVEYTISLEKVYAK